MPTPYPRYPDDEPFTEEEKAIVETALSILPHLGPEATAAYLDKATHEGGYEHEEDT